MMRHFTVRLGSLFRRERLEQQLDAELRYHIDMLVEQNLAAGMSPAAARREALRVFGAVDGVKDDVRDKWLSRFVEVAVQDVRYGMRSLRRNPGFALVIIITMALGIGANTAIFSVVNGVLLRPLPYKDGDQLVVLHQGQGDALGPNDQGFSPKEMEDYRQARSLSDVVEFHNMFFNLLGRAEPERVSTGVVSANYFDVLGVKPIYGRTFVDADDKPGAPAVLVLSNGYWERSFGGDPNIVGKVFRMNDKPHTVVGVMPPVPQYPLEVDVYMPSSACPFRSNPRNIEARQFRLLTAFARVKPEVTHEKAQADLDIRFRQLQQDLQGRLPAGERLPRRRGAAQDGPDLELHVHAVDPAGDRRLRAADRLRVDRQPAAGADGAARARDLRARGPRRHPRPPAPATADREPAAGRLRRRAGTGAVGALAPAARQLRGALHAAVAGDRHRPQRAVLHARRVGRDRPGLRFDPGLARASTSRRRCATAARSRIRARRCAAR
jgi:hypothetical protein